jgi:trk system potassium uptake protein TrkA
MNIIIAGDSELTLHMASIMANEKLNVSLICPDKELTKNIESHTDLMTFNGDSTDIRLLNEAGIKKADLLLSLYLDGSHNLLTAIIGKKLGAKKCIAKVHNIEATRDECKQIYNQLGVDFLVSPEKIVTNEVVNLLKNTAATEFFNFSNNLLSIFVIKLESGAPVLGKSLREIANSEIDLEFRAVGIHRGTRTFIPRGSDEFQENDLAYVISKPEGFEKLLQLSGKKTYQVKNVMIVGGGELGTLVASILEKTLNITLFEIDPKRCAELGEILSDALIINGDARDITLMEDEKIDKMDALVALTRSSETNILTCLLAKKYGVKKTIALVENLDFIDISRSTGIDTVINKKIATASYITRFIMRSEVVSTKCLTNTDAEVFEFVAKENSPVTKKPIRKLNLTGKAIIGGFIRNNQGFISKGDLQIEAGDRVVVFSLPQAFHLVDKMFKANE